MKNTKLYTGLSTGSLLLVAFVVLKLCNVIDWSWFWVLSPIWIPVFGFFAGFVLWVGTRPLRKKRLKKKKAFDSMKQAAWFWSIFIVCAAAAVLFLVYQLMFVA